MKWIGTFIFSILFTLSCAAQFYPGPQPINPETEPGLNLQLKAETSELKKIDLLLQLANINYNNPLRKPAYLHNSLRFAALAKQLSLRFKSPGKYNDAQYISALAYIMLEDRESAEAILPAVNDSTRNNLQLALGFDYLEDATGDFDELMRQSRKHLSDALQLSIRLKNKRNELLARQYLALETYNENNNQNQADSTLRSIIAERKKLKIPGNLGTYFALAEIYEGGERNDKYIAYLMQGIKEMKETGDIRIAGDFYKSLGSGFRKEKETGKQLEAMLTSLYYYRIHPAQGNISDGILYATQAYISQGKYKQALAFLKENLKSYTPYSTQERLNIILAFSNVYLALKQYDLAENYFLQKFAIDKQTGGLNFYSYDRMGFFYIESKQYKKANPYLEKALVLSNHLISSSAISSLHYRLFLADSAAGRYIPAIQHLKATHNYKDSVQNATKNATISKLLVQYEDEKKQHEIRSLKQKELVSEANIKRVSLLRNVTLGGALVALMIAGLLYRQYRIKKRLNDEILAKNKKQEVLLGKLNRTVSEKEWLLKEVHHRVKNNLHTIISLLNIQAEFLKDDALKAIENSQHRIYAMSLIHQKLYASEDVETINIKEYVGELLDYLQSSFGESQNITYKSRIDPLLLNVAQAMPLGLIINEAVTNSIKYAFPDSLQGIISINIHCTNELVTLTIADNGIGIPAVINSAKLSSLGLKLIQGLSEDISADYSIQNDNGTIIRISFNPDYLKQLKILEEEGVI